MSKAKKHAPKKMQPDAVRGPPPLSASNAPHKGGVDHYAARDAMHTLKRAAEIKADPKLHAAAKEHARAEAHHLRKVAGRKS